MITAEQQANRYRYRGVVGQC